MTDGTIKFHCTICGAAHTIPVEQAGAPFHCESCRNIFLAPLKSEEPLPVGPPVVIEPPTVARDAVESATEAGDTETYSVAAEHVAGTGSEGGPEPLGSWPDPLDMPPPVRSKKRRPRQIPSIVDPEADPNADPEYQFADQLVSLFQGTGRWILLGLGLLVIGNVLKLMNPEFGYAISGVFLLAVAVMVIAAWVLLQRHAKQNEPDSSTTLLWPPNIVRYGLEYWPETRRSMQILGLAVGWVAAAWIVAIPFDMVSSFYNTGKPTVADNVKPPIANPPQMMPVAEKPAGAPVVAVNPVPGAPVMQPMQPPQVMPAVPAQADATAIRSVSRQVTVGGVVSMTTILKDGSVLTTVKRTQSKLEPTEDDLRHQAEVNQKVNAAENKVGDVIEIQLTGTDSDLVWGGKNGVYARGSSPGSAAVHAGVVKLDETAKVKITIVEPQTEYPAIDQNGVNSLAGGAEARFGFKVERAE